MLATAQHHAYHDPLTDLRNRTLFDEMASREIAQAYRDGTQLAILAIDLDGFKAVNDLHGHAAGDRVLKSVATRITSLIRGSDVVSRRGGDEFSVLLVDVDGSGTRLIADKLLAALSLPYADVTPPVSASIGVARYPHDATTLKALLECADEALYMAKNAGKRRVVGDF
jgi:diguanylate cyclase (GGDEF)-like protein